MIKGPAWLSQALLLSMLHAFGLVSASRGASHGRRLMRNPTGSLRSTLWLIQLSLGEAARARTQKGEDHMLIHDVDCQSVAHKHIVSRVQAATMLAS
jgi:hypothetical protein